MATAARTSYTGLNSREDRAAAVDVIASATFSVRPTTGDVTMHAVIGDDEAEARRLALLLGAKCRRDERTGWALALRYGTLLAVMDEILGDVDDEARARWSAALDLSHSCRTRNRVARDANPAAVASVFDDYAARFGTVKNKDGTRRLRIRVYRDDADEAREVAALLGSDARRCEAVEGRWVITVEGVCASMLAGKVRDSLGDDAAARLGYAEATIAESRTTAAAIAAA